MNNILKTIALFAAVLLSAAACSKWTSQEPVDFNYLTIEDKNPELYEAYMQSIRDYHATEHQVLIARFDNKASAPAGRADHISCLPDSVDYVVVNNYELITPATLTEMNEMREKKAIPSLISLDFAALDKEYKAYLESLPAEPEEAEETEEGEGEEVVLDSRSQWFADKAASFVSYARQYNVDGIMVSYTGKGLLSLKDDEKVAVKAFQEAFFAPLLSYVAETGSLFFYEGNPTTLVVPEDVLASARYIIVPAEDVTTTVGFNFEVMMSMGAGIPSDRFVIGVTALNVADDTATDGLFSGGITAIEGAATWAVAPESSYSKAGVCVNHAQFDYYDNQNAYRGINNAIATMNPSPIK